MKEVNQNLNQKILDLESVLELTKEKLQKQEKMWMKSIEATSPRSTKQKAANNL